MGSVWFKRIEFIATMSELAGYKSGLALSRDNLLELVPPFGELFDGDDEALLRVRSEEVEELFGDLLYAVGSASSPGITIPTISLYHKYRKTQDGLELYENIMNLFIEWGGGHREGPFELSEFIQLADERFGPKGLSMALELADGLMQSQHKHPWNTYRRIDWKDTTELDGLFESEKLGSAHGRFFDQRFIDYLSRNFDSITRINWRQFEGLAAEFFDRAGFRVNIGPGRNDDGVDLRVWRSDDPEESPPALLVQCKRQREEVGKVVVKALWADIVNENARSGLIVTTSALSPGAKRVCTARAYPVAEANRETINRWVNAMRTPNSGVFMGE